MLQTDRPASAESLLLQRLHLIDAPLTVDLDKARREMDHGPVVSREFGLEAMRAVRAPGMRADSRESAAARQVWLSASGGNGGSGRAATSAAFACSMPRARSSIAVICTS